MKFTFHQVVICSAILFSVSTPESFAQTCGSCHGMPPLDAPNGVALPNRIKGSHELHNPANATPTDCALCHGYHNPTLYLHLNDRVDFVSNFNNSADAHYYTPSNQVGDPSIPRSGYPAPTLGTCSNVNCHWGTKTLEWGTHSPSTLAKCGSCHKAPPADGGHPAASGPGAKHGVYYGLTETSCNKCHPNYTNGQHAMSVGKRALLVQFNTVGTSGGTYSGDVSFPKFMTNPVRNGSCSNLYCHSDGKGTYPKRDLVWGGRALDCKGCHGNDPAPDFQSVAGEPNYANAGPNSLRSNSHKKHVALGGASTCVYCHAQSIQSDNAIRFTSTGTAHVDGTIQVSAGGGKSFNWNSENKTCSNVSCHGSNPSPAAWGGGVSCTDCHGNGG